MPKVENLLNIKLEKFILNMIEERKLQEGDRLPSDRELAKVFKTSNTPVRQAAQVLINKGLLERISGKGTFVKSTKTNNILTNKLAIIYITAESEFFTSTFYAEIFQGLGQEANNKQKTMVIRPIKRQASDNPNNAFFELHNEVDGFIVVDSLPNLFNQIEPTVQQMEKPVVFINYEDQAGMADCVVSDNIENTKKMVSFLIKLGHTRIACLSHKGEHFRRDLHPNILSRVLSYKLSMLEHGMGIDEKMIVALETPHDLATFTQLMKMDNPPTALLCTGDNTALGIYEMAEQLNLAIPQDITVVGYGDIKDCLYVSPRLTSIHMPKREMGEKAVRRLVEKINEQHNGIVSSPAKIVLPGDIIERGSHGAVS